jgi:3-hydroxyacyl-CoA dehydrogenase
MDKRMSLLTPTLDWDVIKEADIVIEAVFEEMEIKKEIFTKIDNLAKEGKLNPNIYKTYPLENTVDALLELRNRSVIGKVCIKP